MTPVTRTKEEALAALVIASLQGRINRPIKVVRKDGKEMARA